MARMNGNGEVNVKRLLDVLGKAGLNLPPDTTEENLFSRLYVAAVAVTEARNGGGNSTRNMDQQTLAAINGGTQAFGTAQGAMAARRDAAARTPMGGFLLANRYRQLADEMAATGHLPARRSAGQ